MHARPWVASVLQTSALVLLCLLASTARAVYLDPDRVFAIEHRTPKLRWFTIDAAPEWKTGVAPVPARPGQPHRITLNPGEVTTLRIASPGLLRIRPETPAARLDALEYSISNGSGLYQQLKPGFQPKQRELLLQPDQPADVMYRIRHPAGYDDAVEFSAYRAVFLPNRGSGPEQSAVMGGQNTVRLSVDRAPGEEFSRQGVFEPLSIALEKTKGREITDFALRVRMDLSDPQHADTRQLVVRIDVNGAPWREFFLHSAPERNSLVYLDGAPALTGREETIHFRVPGASESVQVQTSVPSFVQLGAMKAPDFLWAVNRQAGQAAPTAASEDTSKTAEITSHAAPSKWADRDRASNTAQWVEHLFDLGRDNRVRHTGLAATSMLEQASSSRPDLQTLQRAAQRLSSAVSSWRPIYPMVSGGGLQSRSVRVMMPAQPSSAHRPRSFWVDTGRAAGQLERALTGTLASSPSGVGLEYVLEPASHPSSLLLAVPSEQTGRLRIQFDEQEPFLIESVAGMAPGSGPANLSRTQLTTLLAADLDATSPISVRTSFAAAHPERPAVAVRTARIPLPASISRVRVMPEAPAAGALEIAAWVRASRTASLEEASYLYYLDTPGVDANEIFLTALREALQCDADPAGCWSDELVFGAASTPGPAHTTRVLRNDWLPMFRLLRSRLDLFRGDEPFHVAPDSGSGRNSGSITRARGLMDRSEWLPALEEWSLLAASGDPARAVEGKLGQVRALQQLGEARTAEQLLKRFMLQPGDTGLRAEAARMLEEQYLRDDSPRKRTGLQVAQLLDGVTTDEVDKLVRALLDEGFDALAIRAHLASGIETGHDTLYAALLRKRWWRTLDRLLAQEPAPVRKLWKGLEAGAQGDLASAVTLLKQAGPAGVRWAKVIDEGRMIRARLGSPDPDARDRATESWQAWWNGLPGGRRFVEADSSVLDSAGTALLSVPARGLSLTSWRASAEHPVIASVTGPARVRFAVRPLHAENRTGLYPAKNGLLNLEWENVATRSFAYAGNRPSAGLKLLSPGQLVGTEVIREVNLPDGVHILKIWPDAGEALVQLEREQPALTLDVLPQPDALRVAWIRQHGWPKPTQQMPQTVTTGPLSVLPETLRTALQRMLRENSAGQAWIERPADGDNDGANLIAVGGDFSAGKTVPPWSELRQWMDRSLRPAPGQTVQISDAANPISEALAAEDSLAGAGARAGTQEDGVQPGIGNTVAGRQREQLLAAFLGSATTDPARLAELMHAAQQYPEDPDIQALASAARNRGAGWRAVSAVEHSAGVRRVPVRGWSPETPAVRVRRALMGDRFTTGTVLGGGQALTLVMHNPGPTRIRISLRDMAMLSVDRGPATLDLFLDHRAVGSLQMRPQQVNRRTLEIAAGDHEIRIEARARTFGQSVHVLMEEYQPDADRWVVVSTERTRTYQVATREEPVVYRPAGPVWIRIDAVRDGVVSPAYRFVNGPGEKLVLRAEGNRDTAFYRIFEYVEKPRPERLRKLHPTPTSIAETSLAAVEPVQQLRQPAFRDRLPLGRQQDGTPGLYTRYALRRTTDPDGIGGKRRDHALDLGIEYRKRMQGEGQDAYVSSALFVREPGSGDPLLGLKSRLDRYRHGSPWSVGGQAFLYVQNLDEVDGPAWGAQLRAHASHRHAFSDATRQTVSVQPFVRGLGLSRSEADHSNPDPDLYSRYKQDHQYGARLAWSGRHDLFADTRLRAGSTLQTNEDLDLFAPDQVDASLGIDQKVGPFDFGLAYRSRVYFDDADRSGAVTRNRLTLSGEWANWSHSGNRLNLRLEAARDLERGLWTAHATLAWYFGAGREYTDYRPGEIRFRTLRELDMPDDWNPSIDE